MMINTFSLVLCCGCVYFTVILQAAEDKDRVWLERSQIILEQAEKQAIPEWLRVTPTEDARTFAEFIARDALNKLPEDFADDFEGSAFEREQKDAVIAFVSLSMPDATLKSLLNAASGRRVRIVVRGMKPGSGQLLDTMKEFHRLAKGIEPLPDVSINPPLFQEYNIEVVPTLLMKHGANAVVQARGTVAIDWFREQVAQRKPQKDSDLGKHGQTYEIAEIDMIEYMKTRMAEIDWEEKKRKTIASYWKRRPDMIDLPPALKDRVFTVDPSFVVTEDILLPDDVILAYAGDRVNPLDQISFTKTIIVFDGLHKAQLELAKQQADRIRSEGRGLILMTSTVDKERGWEWLVELQEYFQYRVYVLNREVAERFHLSRSPAVIQQAGKVFEIREYRVSL